MLQLAPAPGESPVSNRASRYTLDVYYNISWGQPHVHFISLAFGVGVLRVYNNNTSFVAFTRNWHDTSMNA